MRALVRARDFEVDRITRACEINLAANSNTDLDKLDKHSFELSLLNEKLRVNNENIFMDFLVRKMNF